MPKHAIPDDLNSLPPAGTDGLSLEALRIRRGLGRFLAHQGWVWLPEVSLPNKRRADLLAMDPKGHFLIVEIKSGLADYRADSKWQDYLPFCDYFGFGVAPEFPREIIPEEVGLLLADAYEAHQERPYHHAPLAPARRKALMLRFAGLAARKHMSALDPDGRF